MSIPCLKTCLDHIEDMFTHVNTLHKDMFTLIRFDIVTMTSPGFLCDFSVIYEVKSYRDVAMT